MLAMILAQLGQEEEARAETAEVLRLDSGFTVSGTAKSLAAFKHAKDHEHFLVRCGVPASLRQASESCSQDSRGSVPIETCGRETHLAKPWRTCQ